MVLVLVLQSRFNLPLLPVSQHADVIKVYTSPGTDLIAC
jgi:hypothetical protein